MIKEFIVVEGKKDAEAVLRAVDAQCIITYGYSLPHTVIEQIRRGKEQRGVIILTDPDYAGEQIRRRINRLVPGCKHAFLTREEATAHNDIGVEQASTETIYNALSHVRTENYISRTEFTVEDLTQHSLVGQGGAADKRNRVGKILGIGYANAKQFLRRLNMYGVTREEFYKALNE